MARRRLFDDKGETIKMKHVEVKKPTAGRERFFDETGMSEFEKAQQEVKEERKYVDPFAGQEIRQAEPVEKKSWFKKISEKVAPYFLDIPDILKKPEKLDTKESIKSLEDYRLSYLRQQRSQKAFKKAGVTSEHILNPEKFIPEDYEEPEGFYGSVKEGIIAGYYSSIKPAIGSVVESLGHEVKSPEMIAWGEQYADKQVAYVLKHPELLRPTDVEGPFEGGLGDKRWYGRTIGETIPFITTIIGASTFTAITTKNPLIVKEVAFATTMSIEQGNAYRGMIEKGIAPDKAAPASAIYGATAAMIENSFGFKPADIAMNATGKSVVKNSYKNFLKNELPKYSKEFLGKVVTEGAEESAQQFSENLVTKWLEESQGLWEGVAESFPAGVVGALPFGGADILSRTIGERTGITPAYMEEIKKEVEITAIERQKELDTFIEEEQKISPIKGVYSVLEEKAISSGFSTVKIREKPIIDRINKQNAPTGVGPNGELFVHLPTLKEDVEALKSGESFKVEIGGVESIIQKIGEMTDTDVINQYLDILLKFEKKHLEQMTIEEATEIMEGRGIEVAKKMDERVVGKEEVGPFVANELGAEIKVSDMEEEGKSIDLTIGDALIKAKIKEIKDNVYLNAIWTRKADKPSEDFPGTGQGTKFVEALKKYADKTGKTVNITDVTDKAISYWERFKWLTRKDGIETVVAGKKRVSDISFIYDPKEKVTIEKEVIKEDKEKAKISEKKKLQKVIAEVKEDKKKIEPLTKEEKPAKKIAKKEILSKEEIADMKELKKEKDIVDKEIAEIEKDEVRVKAGKELAKRIKREERIVGKIIKHKGEDYEVLEDFWYAPARDENVTRIQNIKTKKSIIIAESELVIEPKEIRELKPTEAKTKEEILKEAKELDIPEYLIFGDKTKYKRPLIGKIELKFLLKNSDEFRENPILTVTPDKSLEFVGEKTKFTIKAEALQLKKDNLVIGEKIKIDEKLLKKKDAQMQMRVVGKGGAVGASIGTFADGTPIKTGSLKEILPVQFPDLIHLARQIGSVVSINKRLKTSHGIFRPALETIELHKDLFSNTEQAAKTLAHEIGHLTDWLPDKRMDRGNILGRIFSLRKFLKWTYGEHEIKNEEYKKELWELSKYWRPMPEIVSDSFLKYRKSPAELYADAISVLLNSPGILQEKAPKFYKSFFENLDKKPKVFEEFFSLQEELRTGSNELIEKWRKRIGGTKGMFKGADYKSIEIQEIKNEQNKKDRSAGQLWMQTKRGVFSLHADYETKVKEVKKKGGVVNDNENPVYYLNERNYVGSKIKTAIERYLTPALEEIKKHGITQDEFGEMLMYERILKGDRGEVANPGGFQKEFVEEMLGESIDPKTKELKQNEKSLKEELGAEKFEILKEQAASFRFGLKSIFEIGHKEGIYNDMLYKVMQENKYYVPFKPIKYMDKKTKAKVSRKVGTLNDIENPINTSIEKAMAIIRAVENNKAKRTGLLFLQKEFSEDIEKAETRFVNNRLEIIDVKNKTVSYMKDGRPVGFYTPEYIADSLNNKTTEEIKVITHTLGRLNRKWFKPVFVGINTGFHVANFSRDFFRFWKNIPGMSFARSFKLYYKAYPHARKKAKAKKDEIVIKMEEEGILGLTLNDYMAGGTEEDVQNEIILQKIGLAQESKSPLGKRKILKPFAFVLDKIREMGDTIEALPKIAGYIHFKGDEAGAKISMKEKDFIRRYVGSPDFFAKGSWTKNTNDVFLFSNAIIQGVRSDYEIATMPETRSEFWWKTTKATFVPKILMAMATMGMFGKLLKEIMDEATEYDKTNYVTIPIGKDVNKKAIYFRLPQDETSRFLGGMFWKSQRFLTSRDVESLQDVVGLWGGQLPAITPAIALPGDLFQFATGKNVYDVYRQRTVLTEDQVAAGWKYKAKPVATYVWNQAGGNIFLKLYSGEPTVPLTPKENFLRLPIISNVVGRFFKVTDYGKVEILRREVTDPIRKEVAEKRMEDKKLINEYVVKIRESSGFFEKRKLERELAEKIIGHKPKGSEEISEAKRIIKKLDIAVIKGQSDETVNSLIYARTNKEKIELLNRYKGTMSDTEFSDLRTLLLKHRIVSRDVFNQLNK